MFLVLVGLAEALCVTVLVLVGVWVGLYRGGVAWDGSTKEFNVHPICMILGLIVFNGNALMLYRGFKETPKMTVKIAHATLHCLALICACVGLTAVWQYHDDNGLPTLYSLHSWVGITVFALFAAQWVIGFCIFLWPGGRLGQRDNYKPIHIFFGVFLFAAACATALIGIDEKLFLAIPTTYSSRPAESYVANFLGYAIFALAGVVTFTVTFVPWRRPAEDSGEWHPLVSSTPAPPQQGE